jgi:glycyl-tRNA synthetase alpha subunit
MTFHNLIFKLSQLIEALLASGLIWPALEHCLKCSHPFNVLDASNSIGVTERTSYILRVRQLAVGVAKVCRRDGAESDGLIAPGHDGIADRPLGHRSCGRTLV